MSRLSKDAISPQTAFQMARMAERQALAENGGEDTGLNDQDLLSRLLEEQANNPSLPPWQVHNQSPGTRID